MFMLQCLVQYRYGTTTAQALKTLWSQGGIPRFYNGLAPALIQVSMRCSASCSLLRAWNPSA